MSENNQTTPERRPFWRRKETWAVAVALAVLGAAVVAVPTAMAFRGFGGHGFAHDPERAREHAAVAVEWAYASSPIPQRMVWCTIRYGPFWRIGKDICGLAPRVG